MKTLKNLFIFYLYKAWFSPLVFRSALHYQSIPLLCSKPWAEISLFSHSEHVIISLESKQSSKSSEEQRGKKGKYQSLIQLITLFFFFMEVAF